MGGPWFTVQTSGEWREIGTTLWISNGERHDGARVELRVRLEETNDES